MWWSEQTDAMRKLVRQLVKAGQLDFVNGGCACHSAYWLLHGMLWRPV